MKKSRNKERSETYSKNSEELQELVTSEEEIGETLQRMVKSSNIGTKVAQVQVQSKWAYAYYEIISFT